MRMMKKVLGTVTVLALSVSLLAGCGSTAASPVSSAASTAAESTTSSVVSETTSAAADENEAAAAQLLNDLTGSYQELWPDRKSTRLNSSHLARSRMPSSA